MFGIKIYNVSWFKIHVMLRILVKNLIVKVIVKVAFSVCLCFFFKNR